MFCQFWTIVYISGSHLSYRIGHLIYINHGVRNQLSFLLVPIHQNRTISCKILGLYVRSVIFIKNNQILSRYHPLALQHMEGHIHCLSNFS